MTWNHDIRLAPHGRYVVQQRRAGIDIRVFVPERVILATKCGKVTLSHYMPEEKRWEMLHHGEQPIAWMHCQPGQALPEHPYSSATSSRQASEPGAEPPPSVSGTNSYSLPSPIEAADRPDAIPLAASGQQSMAEA